MNIQVLIVDDDVALCDAMYEFIKMFGYQTARVYSAEQAIELLEKRGFHIVITDIILPEMSGLELTCLIKEKYDADVIVMTGHREDYSYKEAIDKGASDFLFKPLRFEELLLRLKRVLREQLLIKERDRMLKNLQALVITDDLTGLYNSRHFHERLKTEADRAIRYKRPVSLLFLDVDSFKQYNDTYGHMEGDRILTRIGQIMKSGLRKTDSIYRYGGDEFTAILPETTGRDAHVAAQRIIRMMETETFFTEIGKSLDITVSIGITEYYAGEDLAAFIKRADMAMFRSKQQGRNKITSLYAEKPS
ncbi:GGDEF domain-containing response regulator [Desulfonema magnum]|uniref:diguanylate cyclase n=1 Tax=Desulfonema magnum TaxID=45655 RepID=A0A975BLF7_9BACT|nr:GGDEF domain-containing response regulator [Desulfonema magnum]QTA87578.1 Two component system response receiver, GGDEF domain-containing [Desulfonema magnum]